MDDKRGCNATPDEERWLFVGRNPCCPSSPEHRDNLGVRFDEVERVVLKVTTLIAQWDDLYRRSSDRQAAAMMTIQVMEIRTSAATIERGRAGPFVHEEAEPMVRPGRAALAGIQGKLGVDLWQVPRQDSACNKYMLRTWSGPESPGYRQQAARPLCEPRN